MSSELESDVCYHVVPSGESNYDGNYRPGIKRWQPIAGRMASSHCGLTVGTLGSAPFTMLGSEYGKTLPLPFSQAAPTIWNNLPLNSPSVET